jgi:transposase-like protein
MPTARHSPDERRALVASWRSSGLSQSRFALGHGVPQSSFSKWVARYKPAPMALPSFATVEVVDEAPPPPNLLVHLGATGLRVEVPVGFDAAELRRLVGALC